MQPPLLVTAGVEALHAATAVEARTKLDKVSKANDNFFKMCCNKR